jgi:hypothetical protein
MGMKRLCWMGWVLGLGILGLGCPPAYRSPGDAGDGSPSGADDLDARLKEAFGTGPWDSDEDLEPDERATLEEKAAREIYDQCMIEFGLERWQVAFDCFRKLPEKSRWARKAKLRSAECASRLAGDSRVKGKGTSDPAFLPAADVERAIEKKYPEPELAALVKLYLDPRSLEFSLGLKKLLADSRNEELQRKARELDRLVHVVSRTYSGYSTAVRRETVEAARASMDADSQIMPEGLISPRGEAIGRALGQYLAIDGLLSFDAKSYPTAFDAWSECLLRSPSMEACSNGLQQLAQVAEEAFEEVSRLEAAEDWQEAGAKLKFIQSITRPESEAWKRAERRLREYGQEETGTRP